MAWMLITLQGLVACQSAQQSADQGHESATLLHDIKNGSFIVIVVIALIVAWLILLAFLGRIIKAKG